MMTWLVASCPRLVLWIVLHASRLNHLAPFPGSLWTKRSISCTSSMQFKLPVQRASRKTSFSYALFFCISKQQTEYLLVPICKANVNAPAACTLALVRRITESPIPLLFWSGYSSIVLVHSVYLREWTVITSEDPRDRIHPRRWLDVSGSRIDYIWEAALKAVVGVILFRPGISEVCHGSA
jgi:hypothetical protein